MPRQVLARSYGTCIVFELHTSFSTAELTRVPRPPDDALHRCAAAAGRNQEVLDNLHFSRSLPMPRVVFDLSTSIESFGKHLEDNVWPYMRSGWRRTRLATWSSVLQLHGLSGGPCIIGIMHHIKYLVRTTPVSVTCIVDRNGTFVSDDDFYGTVSHIHFPMHATCCLQNMLHYILQAEGGESLIRNVIVSKGWTFAQLEIAYLDAESYHRDTCVYGYEEKENIDAVIQNVHDRRRA